MHSVYSMVTSVSSKVEPYYLLALLILLILQLVLVILLF
nr:MAG TPA: hypothetical protein [Caudoviricetes sp.]DAU07124.1 MAG TPA: hypothetical protein [Caudoviricetes sp.]